MARLILSTNELNKDAKTQFGQLSTGFQDISSWADRTLTRIIGLVTDSDTSDVSTTDINFQPIPNMTVSVNTNNPLVLINASVCVSGEGYIGLFVNDLLVGQKYFSHGSNAINFGLDTVRDIRSGSSKISLGWRMVSGTVTKKVTENTIQVTSFNS